MDKFWQYLWMTFRYKRLLFTALAAALLDAACKAGGLASVSAIIDLFFDKNVSLYTYMEERIQKLQGYDVDLSGLLPYVPTDEWEGLALTLGFIFVLAIIGSVARFTHEYLSFTVVLRTVNRIRRVVFSRIIHLPMSAVTEEKSAELVSKVVRDSQALARGFNALTGRTITGVFGGLAMLGLAFVFDWKLSLIFMVVVPPIGLLIRKFGKRIRKSSQKALKEYGHMLAAISESVQSLRVVKVHHAEGYERRRFNQINRRVMARQMRTRTARALSAPTIETLSLLGLSIVVLIAAWSVLPDGDRKAPIKVLLALVASGISFRQLAGLNNSLQEAAAAAENIDQVLHMPVETTPRHDVERSRPTLPRHHRSVTFENVTFTYPGAERPTLLGITFAVPHGSVCAVVGGNGSGKTTLLGLLPRLYEPDNGRVLVDGLDIAQHKLRSVRAQMAMVSQDAVLFDGTVAQNIIYGSRQATMEQVIEAAKRAKAHDFVTAMPEGYDAEVGERGQRLSGGQRQRIAIARAILRDPAILVLDEATSQIDADSESQINAALAGFTKGRTTFVIAHRLSTVINADTIVVLDAGRVVATGKHAELLKTCEAYQTLCRTQLHGAGA